jgi:TolB-like 6-blade propeller-like
MRKAIMFLYCLCLVVSCASFNAPDNADLIFTKFPEKRQLALSKVFDFNIGNVSRMYVADSTLLLKNHDGMNDYFFYQYNMANHELLQKYIQGGRGRGQAFGSLCSGVYKDKLWMFDLTARKIIFAKLRDTLIEEYKVPRFYYNIQPIEGLKILANGSLQSDYKVQQVDLATGKETMGFVKYTNIPEGMNPSSWKRAHESLLYMSPDEQKGVMAYLMTDQLEIFDIKNKRNKLISGPENFKAEFETYKDGAEEMIQRTKKSRQAFENGVVTNKYIYMLYSGKYNNEKNSFYGKSVFVYDWEGNPVKEIKLDREVLCITVTPDDRSLYAFDPKAKCIVKGKLD